MNHRNMVMDQVCSARGKSVIENRVVATTKFELNENCPWRVFLEAK